MITIVTWIWYVPMIVRVFGENPWLQPKTFPPIEGGEECEFKTLDGLRLRGSYLPTGTRARRGVVVFAHELGSNRWAATPLALIETPDVSILHHSGR